MSNVNVNAFAALRDTFSAELADGNDADTAKVHDAFDPSRVTIVDKSYGENDEGDYDYYTIHHVMYADADADGATGETYKIHQVRSCASSNIGGAWGSEHTAALADGGKTLKVPIRHTTL